MLRRQAERRQKDRTSGGGGKRGEWRDELKMRELEGKGREEEEGEEEEEEINSRRAKAGQESVLG